MPCALRIRTSDKVGADEETDMFEPGPLAALLEVAIAADAADERRVDRLVRPRATLLLKERDIPGRVFANDAEHRVPRGTRW